VPTVPQCDPTTANLEIPRHDLGARNESIARGAKMSVRRIVAIPIELVAGSGIVHKNYLVREGSNKSWGVSAASLHGNPYQRSLWLVIDPAGKKTCHDGKSE